MLSKEQLAAMRHILSSPDQVIAVRGVAGAGKTTLMQDVVPAIESSGRKVFAFAPSASASRGTQREAGFANADTVARLLIDTRLQRQIQGQVIWIDEVGLIGVRDMSRILKVAGPETIIIITGDAEQHTPVARGDTFRLFQRFSGLKVAEVKHVRRQEQEEYRAAVTALSQGDLSTAFARLEGLGAIWEIDDAGQRYALLASDYVELLRRGSAPLVVSPTHAEGARVTLAIRDAMKADGKLGADHKFLQYRSLQWENSERGHADFYEPGMMVQFNQNAPGIKRGSLFKVTGRSEQGSVMIEGSKGIAMALPLEHSDRFQVFETREIALSRGDMIRITRNGDSANGKRLNNGDTFSIKDIGKNGEIILSNGAVLYKNHGHLDYGYCSTSHSSQSKTVRDVLVAQSVDSFLASSREQFYVSVSRGRDTVRIYTDNRRELQEAVGNTSTRLSGMEFAGITGQDFTPLMAPEALNGDQWRKHVRSLHSEDKAKSFVETLLKQRHQNALAKPEAFSWENYIQMRRANATTDGKARARVGHEPKKLSGDKVFQQRQSTIRPTSPQHAVEKKPDPAQLGQEAAKQEKAEPARSKGKLGRIEAALTSSANHLKSVLSRSQNPPKPPGPQEPGKPKREPILPLRGIKAAAQHVMKKEGKQAEKKPQKVATITPPAPKRGR
ncbi:MAG: AAA family ATPase [Candidatus Methylacidiphilales bacterium]